MGKQLHKEAATHCAQEALHTPSDFWLHLPCTCRRKRMKGIRRHLMESSCKLARIQMSASSAQCNSLDWPCKESLRSTYLPSREWNGKRKGVLMIEDIMKIEIQSAEPVATPACVSTRQPFAGYALPVQHLCDRQAAGILPETALACLEQELHRMKRP